MSYCPECEAVIDEEFEDIGEIISCPECGIELEVISIDPVEYDVALIDDEEDERTLSNRQQTAAQALETIAERMQTPAQRLERSLTPWATYLVLPLFAFANAGVPIQGNLVEALR